MRSLKQLLIGTAVMAIVTLAQHRAEALLIDSFDDNPAPLLDMTVNTGSSDVNTQTGVTGVVGGSRDAKLSVSGGPTGARGTMAILGSPGDGFLGMGAQSNAKGTWELEYSILAGIDVTDGGTANGIAMHFLTADLAGGTVTATLDLFGGGSVTQSKAKSAGPEEFVLKFADFSTAVAPGTVVTRIHFEIQGPPNGDYDLDFIDTAVHTPEPSTWAMFGLGLVGLTGWGWRRRRQRVAA